jgi:multiple sugar transport system ATP-binding protein
VEAGQPVLFGIRPEHLELAPEGFPARVSVVEPTGSETMVFLRFGDSEIVALFRERHNFKPGDTVHLRPRADQVHLFHAEKGQRL